MKISRIHWIAFLFLFPGSTLAQDRTEKNTADESQKGSHDLGNLGLEDLMNVKVGGGTMPLRDLKDVTAAVYVLSSEDIRRSGANNVPDMLRLVPGVHVAQIDNNKWMVAIRGFATRYANKLQVLIDGHSIYSPAFSGVYWDQIGLTADEIERIEVIRGSDGSLWGANAVNGIINIVTKNSADTVGGFLRESVATNAAGDHYARIGTTDTNGNSFRLTARSARFGQSVAQTYPSADASESNWVNFRSDRKLNQRDLMTVTGSLYSGKLGQSTFLPTLDEPNRIVDSRYPVSDLNVSASIVSQASKKEVSELKFSYNKSIRMAPEIGLHLSTLDFGYNRSSKLGVDSNIFYGVGFRQVGAQFANTSIVNVSRPDFRPTTYSTYVQYEKDLSAKTQLTLGTTIEHNAYTGYEVQPSARVLYRKDPTESYWFSASRAVRTPSPADTLCTFLFGVFQDPDSGLPVQVIAKTDNQFKSESVISLEAGWRKEFSDKVQVDLTAFYNSYSNLRSIEFTDNQFVNDSTPHIDSNYIFRNGRQAKTYGLELGLNARMNDDWHVTTNISYIDDHFTLRPGAIEAYPLEGTDGSSSVPKWQANIRSSWNLSDSLKFDVNGYFMGANRSLSHSPSMRLDSRFVWQLPNNWQVTLFGQNLLGPSNLEGASSFNEIPVRMRRTIGLQVGFRF